MNSEDVYTSAWIHTRYGEFELDNPRFDIRDIAHALGQLARFNGHCFRFHNVADHSLMVSYLMQKYVGGDPLEGLLHDASEAYLSDVPAPFKHLLPDWKRIEEPLDVKLRLSYDLPMTKTPECKEADWLALFIEAEQLVNGRGADFEDPLQLRGRALQLLDGDPMLNLLDAPVADPVTSAEAFLAAYEFLT